MNTKNIVLVLPVTNKEKLAEFVETCLQDKVGLIAIVGEGAAEIEDEIDWLIIGNGDDDRRFIATSSHENENLPGVLELAGSFSAKGQATVKVVKL